MFILICRFLRLVCETYGIREAVGVLRKFEFYLATIYFKVLLKNL